MNLIQLQYFVTVAENSSYSLAAEKLYTSQSSVSKQILSLEKELNTQLFDRSHRKISLTEQGRITYAYVKEILNNYDSLLADLSSYEANPKGQLTLGSIPVFSHYNLLDLIREFSEYYPDIEVRLMEMEASDLMVAIKNQEVDLAFFRQEFTDSSMDFIPILHDTLIAALPYSHPLARKRKIDIMDLADENFLFLDKSTMHYTPTYNLCKNHGFSPNIIYVSTHIENILEMIEKEMGVALLMKTVASGLNNGRVKLIPLNLPKEEITSVVGLARPKRKSANPVTLAFWNWAKEKYNLA